MQDTDKQLDSLSLNEAAEAATAPANAGNDMPPGETMPSLEELLKAAELKAEEHHDAWLRAKAETENVRRRAQDDIAKAGKFASREVRRRTAGRQGQPGSRPGQPEPGCRGPARRRRTDPQATGGRLRKVQRRAKSTRWARSSIRIATRRSARSKPMASPTGSSTCCKRAMPCTSASCARPWWWFRKPAPQRSHPPLEARGNTPISKAG